MSHNENFFKGSIGRTYQDSQPWWPDELSAPKGAPNIVIIVLDDVGFADLGCYDRVHEAEVFSDHDCLLRRGHPEAIEGPDARHSPDLKRGAHH